MCQLPVSEQNDQQRSYCFGEFILDMRRGSLFRKDSEIRLRPKSLAVLHYMVQHPGALVSRDELLYHFTKWLFLLIFILVSSHPLLLAETRCRPSEVN